MENLQRMLMSSSENSFYIPFRMPQREHPKQPYRDRLIQHQVSTSFATELTQRPREGLRTWSCVAGFTKLLYSKINSATKHAMSAGPVLCTRLRCVLIFLLYVLYQDKKWKKKKETCLNYSSAKTFDKSTCFKWAMLCWVRRTLLINRSRCRSAEHQKQRCFIWVALVSTSGEHRISYEARRSGRVRAWGHGVALPCLQIQTMGW